MIFVKFSFRWKLLHEGKLCFLVNVINNKLFIIEDIEKQKILKLINLGCSLSELKENYSTIWNQFKKELEANYVIFYSNSQFAYTDNPTLGGILAASSQYLAKPASIYRLSVDLNNRWNVSC